MNIIIFGGAFDPVHNGHINMAINAQKDLLGEVFFVPAPISIWKKESVSKIDKINMLELAIKPYEHFHIDLFELNNGKDINYSIDTVKYFKKKYPKDKLYFLIGSDQVERFHLWKEADKISKLANIVYFERPDVIMTTENIVKYNIKAIKGPGVVVSSSEIRNLKNLNIPDEVLYYIIDNKLYFVDKMKQYIDEKRLNHSISVAKTAYEIALANKVDNPHKYFIAGLLHDIGKTNNIEKESEIVEKHFPEYKDMPSFSYHQFVGAYLAENEFDIHDENILRAIKFHATGNANMDLLGKIVYAADKIEPTRPFDSSDLIDAMKQDAETGFIIVLKANKEFLENHRGDINNPLTSNCFKFYLG